jgi:hypothetical protein
MRRNSSLKNRLVCIKKEKTELNVTAECKMVDAYETNTHYRRILVTPRRTNASDIFWRLLLRFIVIYLLQSLFPFSTILKFLLLFSIFKVFSINLYNFTFLIKRAHFLHILRSVQNVAHQLFQKMTAQIPSKFIKFLTKSNFLVGSDERFS